MNGSRIGSRWAGPQWYGGPVGSERRATVRLGPGRTMGLSAVPADPFRSFRPGECRPTMSIMQVIGSQRDRVGRRGLLGVYSALAVGIGFLGRSLGLLWLVFFQGFLDHFTP